MANLFRLLCDAVAAWLHLAVVTPTAMSWLEILSVMFLLALLFRSIASVFQTKKD